MALEFEAQYFRPCGDKCPVVQIEKMLTENKMSFEDALKLISDKLDVVHQTEDEVYALCNRKIKVSELCKDSYARCGTIEINNIS